MSQEVKVLIGIGIFCLLVVVGVAILLGRSPQDKTAPVDTKLLIRDDSQNISTPSAVVTIVEFGDYQCPACGIAHPTILQVLKDFEGRINFVQRHFPLPSHKNASIAAQAAEAAGTQGKFWQMHDKLYETQFDWAESGDPIGVFSGFAAELGLDVNKFKEEVSSNKYLAKIQQDMADGASVGVNSTPTFFINGKKFAGALSYDQFKKEIEEGEK